jgi:FKBP-type peptidyl-prolyl cis-trans isomerase FkpA
LSHEGAESLPRPFAFSFRDFAMTEITRVPLQPIAKGSLGKLWVGVAAAALAAAGIAWAAMPASVNVQTVVAGKGASPTMADVALINYKGTLPDGKVFDQAQFTPMPLEGVVPGFSKALQQMQKGGKYKVVIPSALAYGDKGSGPIPPNTDLTFEIELLDFTSRENFEQQMRMMQQMQQMQGGAHGMPEGAAPPHP